MLFELYDTYGFPLDLTELILKENDLVVNRKEFEKEMEAQKERARSATAVETEDWVTLLQDDVEEFIGYDYLESEITITRYRKITAKNKTLYQLVFNITPFYAESGGQVGDTGYIDNGMEKIEIIDTKKENNLIVHIAKKLPTNIKCEFKAYVNGSRRQNTANNHTGTHLLHQALREVLGTHVEQKGSLVHPDYLRFDFAHFQKMTREEIEAVEKIVNKRIRTNFALEEMREIPVAKAHDMGAMMLFGEKYGDLVRAIKFGDSIELCGGTHVHNTGEIGFFKIISESSISAGVRRIEAVTGEKAEEMIMAQHNLILGIQDMFKASGDLQKNIESLMTDNSKLGKELDSMKQNFINIEKRDLIDRAFEVGGVQVIVANVNPMLGDKLKDLAFQIKKEMNEFVAVLGANVNGKPQLSVIASDELAKSGKINAVEVIRDCAKEIQGGGGGQPFFATAGGKNAQGLDNAIEKAKAFIEEKLA